MDLIGKIVEHKFRGDISTQVVEKVENSKAIFADGSFWFSDNCIPYKG